MILFLITGSLIGYAIVTVMGAALIAGAALALSSPTFQELIRQSFSSDYVRDHVDKVINRSILYRILVNRDQVEDRYFIGNIETSADTGAFPTNPSTNSLVADVWYSPIIYSDDIYVEAEDVISEEEVYMLLSTASTEPDDDLTLNPVGFRPRDDDEAEDYSFNHMDASKFRMVFQFLDLFSAELVPEGESIYG